jgi:tRNA(Ile)-lysidine synthase
MFEAGQRVVVAVSGGPDSTALLHLLAGLREEWGLTLIAAHLNHGLRGADAEADAEYVERLGAELGIRVCVGRADVLETRRRRGGSKQEVARALRHAWLRRVAQEEDAATIALGHTRDDRVETILHNLFRGTGTEGLIGFHAVDPPIVRPLYEVGRSEVEAYCTAEGLVPRLDPSNLDRSYLRNRTRTELLPYLMSYYNSRADLALLRLSDLATADCVALDETATNLSDQLNRAVHDDELRFQCSDFDVLPVALRRRVLRLGIVRLRGDLSGVTFEMVERLLEAGASRLRCAVTLPACERGTVRLLCDGEVLRVVRAARSISPVPWLVELKTPGCTRIERAGIWIETAFCNDPVGLESFRTRVEPTAGRAHWIVMHSHDAPLPWTVRSRRPGDRILRSAGHRKVQDLLIDARIPVALRANIPVLTDCNGRLLAVIGVEIATFAIKSSAEVGVSGCIALAVRGDAL